MNKYGLLFKDAPEPRFELYCDNYDDYPGHCNTLFNSPQEFEQHKLEVHDSIPGRFYSRERRWFNKEYIEREGFTRVTFQLPIRPTRRFKVTKKMLKNLGGISPNTKKCWCGKPKSEWDSKHFQTYCSHKHRDKWWELTDYVGPHKDKYLRKHLRCEKCGKKRDSRMWSDRMEMDHIIAIVLGGHPWDTRNLQTICQECHKKKTKSDVGILAWWKRQAKYDIGPIVVNPQQILVPL